METKGCQCDNLPADLVGLRGSAPVWLDRGFQGPNPVRLSGCDAQARPKAHRALGGFWGPFILCGLHLQLCTVVSLFEFSISCGLPYKFCAVCGSVAFLYELSVPCGLPSRILPALRLWDLPLQISPSLWLCGLPLWILYACLFRSCAAYDPVQILHALRHSLPNDEACAGQ